MTSPESKIDDCEIMAAIDGEPLLADHSDEQKRAFVRLVRLIEHGQSRLNLTSIRDPRAMVRHHLADSLALARATGEYPVDGLIERAADIGTGAGFPLLPMAIVGPEIRWLGVESIRKKAEFVRAAAGALGLENVEVAAERAEELGRGGGDAGRSGGEGFGGHGSFDLVTSRAVGPVSSLLEVGLPLLRMGGRIYLFKTESAMGEWEACESIEKKLGFNRVGEFEYRLEGDEQQRMILIAEKTDETPAEYPRAAGVPFRKPLVTGIKK